MVSLQSPVILEEMTEANEMAVARAQREQFDRNAAWLRAHSPEVYSQHCGKCICIAGQELFVADTAADALAQATAAHPDDKGRFVHYIPLQKVHRIYAH